VADSRCGPGPAGTRARCGPPDRSSALRQLWSGSDRIFHHPDPLLHSRSTCGHHRSRRHRHRRRNHHGHRHRPTKGSHARCGQHHRRSGLRSACVHPPHDPVSTPVAMRNQLQMTHVARLVAKTTAVTTGTAAETAAETGSLAVTRLGAHAGLRRTVSDGPLTSDALDILWMRSMSAKGQSVLHSQCGPACRSGSTRHRHRRSRHRRHRPRRDPGGRQRRCGPPGRTSSTPWPWGWGTAWVREGYQLVSEVPETIFDHNRRPRLTG
jgi:hypothetical protein